MGTKIVHIWNKAADWMLYQNVRPVSEALSKHWRCLCVSKQFHGAQKCNGYVSDIDSAND